MRYFEFTLTKGESPMPLTASRHQAQAVPVEGELALVYGPDDDEIDDRPAAEIFHDLHPEVLPALVDLIRPYQHLERPLSMRCFWELLRMNHRRDGGVGLPNVHAPWYARKIMETVEGWDGMFRTVDR